MNSVASRELRNHTRAILDRVAAGEELLITVDGLPVGRLLPLVRKPRWLPRQTLIEHIAQLKPDPTLRSELAALAPDTTDDLPEP
jgi:prevent-host-death family protein